LPKDPQGIVFVVDDDPSIRNALDGLLRSVGLSAQLFASTGEFRQSARPDVPCCLVLDIRMAGQSGLEFQHELAASGDDIPIIFITAYGDIAMSVQAMKAGAVEFLTKPFRDQDLLDAIHASFKKSRAQRRALAAIDKIEKLYRTLTPHERETMAMVVSGLPNKEIAVKLKVAEITVKVRRGNVMHKMHAASLPDLVRMAEKLKSTTPPGISDDVEETTGGAVTS
jgi:FixJ family two-component response regulator